MFSFTELKSIERRKVPRKGVPTLIAIKKKDRLYAWCPFCKEFHGHGASEKATTHRNAHCISKSSPFFETGYNIVVLYDEE